jgi:hypothetical protein
MLGVLFFYGFQPCAKDKKRSVKGAFLPILAFHLCFLNALTLEKLDRIILWLPLL